MAYFERLNHSTFRPTEHTGGAWNLTEQHIAPAVGLLTHLVERDGAARANNCFMLTRLSYDILGPLKIEPFDTEVQVRRSGRSVELVEATITQNGRAVLCLRAWLLRVSDTATLAATPEPSIALPGDLDPWELDGLWRGKFVKTLEARRTEHSLGRATSWLRPLHPLIDGEPTSALARAAGLFDVANGLAVRADPMDVAFPNVDLTVHLFGTPRSDWLGFDTSVSFGVNGVGLTHTVLHDEHDGPIGTVAQALTIRTLP